MSTTSNLVLKRVFNNNVVLAVADGQEYILLGRAIGFGRKIGDIVDEKLIEHRFVPEKPSRIERDGILLADVPYPYVQTIQKVVSLASERLNLRPSTALNLALIDHLQFAVRRARDGIQVDFPLKWEVTQLYPDELAAAHDAVAVISKDLGVTLPKDEAVAFALHFVNAQFATPDMAKVIQYTELLKNLFAVISKEWGIEIDQESVGAARFVTHLRYLLVRLQSGRTTPSVAGVADIIREQVPQVLRLAGKLQAVLEKQLGHQMSSDENAYLALHLERLRLDELGRGTLPVS